MGVCVTSFPGSWRSIRTADCMVIAALRGTAGGRNRSVPERAIGAMRAASAQDHLHLHFPVKSAKQAGRRPRYAFTLAMPRARQSSSVAVSALLAVSAKYLRAKDDFLAPIGIKALCVTVGGSCPTVWPHKSRASRLNTLGVWEGTELSNAIR